MATPATQLAHTNEAEPRTKLNLANNFSFRVQSKRQRLLTSKF